ncbi:methylated-DNA--[protein]-cysteine S-methyltransferase [Clostridium sp. 1001271B_151109_B4]|uniref:methylated-DNA--[protein]-cysteine S-methyltransferase n=1 Tax=Clostridium sp. 1001271B_151109_B4 TaxID=2787148 RepID=UPI0018ABE56A|nr:methylated-DNA--[protein]-cysteine S-methyltransferase [Clostridium sp. 1001271B_151109_B4]
MYYSTRYSSPLGAITIASDGENLIGLWIEGQKYFGGTVSEDMIENNDLNIFVITKKWLDRYFAGEKPKISELQLAPSGGEFRKLVWDILCEIPYGEITTYGEIAKKVAFKMNKKSMSSQAVGGAVGHNPISIIIPCHRVIGAKGNLTGYAGGIDKKIGLLEHEGVDTSKLFIREKRKSY